MIEEEKGLQLFSYFHGPVSNTQPCEEITIMDAYAMIKSNRFKSRTAQLRSIREVNAARKYKATQFDYVTFSGVFTKRSDACLLQHSELMVLDFDHVPHLQELKNTLLQDPYLETELMFVSPSGDGLKWIIAIDLKVCTHQEWFASVADYLKDAHGLEVDKSGKDISRACFLPHDPDVYIQPDYGVPWVPRFAIAEDKEGDCKLLNRVPRFAIAEDKEGDCKSPDPIT